MSSRREFEIAFVGLKAGIHEFSYKITDRFFEAYQQQDFRNCKADIKLTLDKKNGFMLLKFEIGGAVEVTCDRCGSTVLPMNLWGNIWKTGVWSPILGLPAGPGAEYRQERAY